jgi:hypothetical protein
MNIVDHLNNESSIDQLPVFVLNTLELFNDNHLENEIINSNGYIFDH